MDESKEERMAAVGVVVDLCVFLDEEERDEGSGGASSEAPVCLCKLSLDDVRRR